MRPESLFAKFVIGVLVLESINLIAIFSSWKGLTSPAVDIPLKCSMDKFLQVTGSYLEINGKKTFLELLAEKCPGQCFDNEMETIVKFKTSVQKLLHECSARTLLRKHSDVSSSKSILTLFTSWADISYLQKVHMKTIANWSRFLPKINLVVFTNETSVANVASEYGWTIFPILHHAAGGIPVLKTMFSTVVKHFQSTFYGFANSDILFSDDLLDTLETIAAKFQLSKERVFVSGRRINVPDLSLEDSASFLNIIEAGNKRGKLFSVSSADYFFTTNAFPWENVPPLVIGRPAIDNFVVLYARQINSTVIDATATLHAIHHTTDKAKRERNKRKDMLYNHRFLTRRGTKPRYYHGHVVCAEWRSFESLCGDKDIVKRKKFPAYC